MQQISDEYNRLLDEGVSITQLYIYHLIVNDERSYRLAENEIEQMIQKATDQQAYGGSLEEIIDRLLDGEEFDGEEEVWY